MILSNLTHCVILRLPDKLKKKTQIALKIRHFNKCFPFLDKESLSVLISEANIEVFCALNELKLMWSELFEMYACVHECDKNNQIEHINA